jgi:predicted peptidase
LETAKKLIDYIVGRYNIDKNRIYATGQSMGFMCCSELNIRYPNLFAASLLFGGQWNPQTMPQLKDKKMWIVVSELNQRAFSNNNETMLNIEMAGTKVGRYWWDGRASQAEFTENVQEALQDGCNIRYSVLKGDSVLPEGKIAENPLAYHTNTWRVGYTIEALRDWLFTCVKA